MGRGAGGRLRARSDALIAAGTGHRPDKLGGYGAAADRRLTLFARSVLGVVRPSGVISGMALGWDMALAEAALDLGIPLLAALPFRGQEARWPEASQARYRGLLARTFRVEVVCEDGYSAWKMQARNEWMVDRCHVLLALWDGSSGGTANCVRYARRVERPRLDLWPLYEKFPGAVPLA